MGYQTSLFRIYFRYGPFELDLNIGGVSRQYCLAQADAQRRALIIESEGQSRASSSGADSRHVKSGLITLLGIAGGSIAGGYMTMSSAILSAGLNTMKIEN